MIHTVEGFGIVNKAEIDVFLELSCSFDDPVDVGNLISGSSAFSKIILNIWKFIVWTMVNVLFKPGLKNFEHYFTSVWDECNCAVVWTFFGIAFLSDVNIRPTKRQKTLVIESDTESEEETHSTGDFTGVSSVTIQYNNPESVSEITE